MKLHSSIRCVAHWRRTYQTHAHPRLFHQHIQLTDGSIARIVSVSDKRPFLKMGVDALSHPSWNPILKNRMLISEHGQVAKFKERFEDITDEASLASFDGLVGMVTSATVKRKATPDGSKSKTTKKK